MTTLTGTTKMSLNATARTPPFSAAILGAAAQLGVLTYVWAGTSARECMVDPLGCITSPATSDPWGRQWLFSMILALGAYVINLFGSGPSIVDRLWSILPIFYCGHFYCSSVRANHRLLCMLGVTVVWGVRLSYNFYKKGGYTGGEDHRWAEVRTWYPGRQWDVFNFLFVTFFQLVEILAFSVPAVAALQSDRPMGPLDTVALGICLTLIVFETIADEQMFAYQTEKYRRIAKGEPLTGNYAKGFIDTGLWAYSRHPNYFCEVALWWAFYLFSVGATGQWINWTIWGAIFLTILFVPPMASIDVTENLSSRKYPAYADYQRRVSRFVPWFPKSETKRA